MYNYNYNNNYKVITKITLVVGDPGGNPASAFLIRSVNGT